jgi:hypothetical protein
MLSFKPLNIFNSNSTQKKKAVDQRKADVKNIFKVFEDISKKEMERSKKLYEEHLSWFNPEPEPEVMIKPVTVTVSEDSFFD